MKLNKEQKEKVILAVIVGIIVVIVLTMFVFSPSLQKIGKLRAMIVEERNRITKAEKEVLELSKMQENLKRQEADVKQYGEVMPQGTADWLLERLNSLASEIGIDFDKIEPRGNISQMGSYLLTGMYLELKTDYHTLARFINKLENTSPFIKILDLSIAGNKNNVTKHVVKFTVGAYVSEKK